MEMDNNTANNNIHTNPDDNLNINNNPNQPVPTQNFQTNTDNITPVTPTEAGLLNANDNQIITLQTQNIENLQNDSNNSTDNQSDLDEDSDVKTLNESKLQSFLNNVKLQLSDKNKKTAAIVAGSILTLILLTVIATYINSRREPPVVAPLNPVVEKPPVIEPDVVELNNRQFEFTFFYPREAELIEENPFSLDPSSYTVLYSRLPHTETDITEENLREGYIFRVIVNKVENDTSLLELSEAKKRYYSGFCPESATLSEIEEIKINEFDATTFLIKDCNGELKHTFTVRNKKVFELVEFHKGDLGYKERYGTTLSDIYNSFELTNKNEPLPSENWITYLNKDAVISFKHPDMDEKCCNIAGPILLEGQVQDEHVIKIVAFGERGTPSLTDKPFNGLAVYQVFKPTDLSFEDYVEKQKQLLAENYSVIIGKTTEGKTKDVLVGSKKGVLLENFAWWGDLIFVNTDNYFLVIAQTEKSPNDFNDVFGEILTTFKFTSTDL